MKFDFDFDKLKAMCMSYAEKGIEAAGDLADRAKRETRILNDQNKLARAQRELGALVYSLAKNGESNQPLLDKYIDAISALEQEIEQLRALNTPVEGGVDTVTVDFNAPEADDTDAEVQPQPEAEQPAGRYCSQCGQQVADGALFCDHCGAQL